MKTIFFYALPALTLAMIGLTYFAYLPAFYSSGISENLILLGVVILGTRLLDAILDPIVGQLSDSGFASPGHYRRKHFLPVGALFLSIGFIAVSMPDVFISSMQPEISFAFWSVLLFLGWTLFAVPYEALGTELSFDYAERSKLFAARDGAIAAGTLLAVVIIEFLKQESGEVFAFRWFSYLSVSLLLATTGLLLLNVSEVVGVQPGGNTRGGFLAPLKNKAFRSILIAYTLSGFGAALPATLLLFFVRYVLGDDIGGYYLGVYLCCCVLGFPLWIYACRHIEKRRAWIGATLVNSGAFLFTLFLGTGDFSWFLLIVVVSGLGFAGTQLYPSSMQADVIDLVEMETGQRQEGAFVGLWSVSRKSAAALGAGIALPLLAVAGFDPDSSVQSEAARTMLSILYAGVPALCALGSLIFLYSYPVSRSEHIAVSDLSAKKWQQGSVLE